MKVYYNRKQLNIALIFGVLWVLIGVISIVGNSENNFLSGFLLIGVVYLILYFVKKHNPYVVITEEYIQVHNYVRKKIQLNDIVDVKYFAGDYTIKSFDKELTIDTNFIDKVSLPAFKIVMEELMVKYAATAVDRQQSTQHFGNGN